LKSTYLFSLEASHIAFIGSAPRLAEDVVRSCRLPSRHARETTRFWRPTTRSGWAPFFLPTGPHPHTCWLATWAGV